MTTPRRVVITGIGLLTSLGNGTAENWQALASGASPHTDSETFAPYTVHPLVDVDWSEQIPKRGDQRQMEPWQRTGTYAAGLALADAGLSDNETLKAAMDMTVAAGGGERDVEVDGAILAEAAAGRNDTGLLVNEKLTTELRPTLFLAQLANLLAGNISIVHKVTGSSRTFMGEDGAGLSAIGDATARIRAGQSDLALVGASYNSEHRDMLLSLEVSHTLAHGGWSPVFDRAAAGGDASGAIAGSGGVFLVLEEASHAAARDAKTYAEINAISADLGPSETLGDRLSSLAASAGLDQADLLLSTTSGVADRTRAEHAFLEGTGKPFADVTSHFGYLREAQHLIGVAIAALSVQAGQCPLVENAGAAGRIGVVAVGLEAAEGVIMLKRGDAS